MKTGAMGLNLDNERVSTRRNFENRILAVRDHLLPLYT